MRTCLFLLLAAGIAPALPILTVPDAAVFNLTPGGTLLLPFSLTPDSASYVVINSVQGALQRYAIEIYPIIDILSNFVSNNAYALAPGGIPWTDTFTPNLPGTTAGGIGSISLPFIATPGQAFGTLLLSYELFDLDPFIDAAAISQGSGTLQAFFTVNIEEPQAIPEPSFLIVVGFALVILGFFKTKTYDE